VYAALRRARGSDAARRRRRTEGDRLLVAPAFVLSSVRSGSTLLRVLLDSHSQIHAPHELHLRNIGVHVRGRYTERALDELGLDRALLRYLLWDRVLDRELQRSGKRVLVSKTPSNVFIADRIADCWPDARFVFLLRHPLVIARSRQRLRPGDDPDRNAARVLRYCEAVEAAREAHPGLTVRYEDLTADPAAVTRSVCEFLEVPWEPSMLDYGRFDHGRYKAGLGDWAEKIRTGKVQRAQPPPDEIPEPLRDVAAAWGYLAQPATVSGHS
jgi:hypothetical protein